MEKRRLKQREDELWRARKAQKFSLRHMNVNAFTDYRCRDDDEEPERHYSHEEIMNIITNDWKNANPFTVEHQCINPISRADYAQEGVEQPVETEEWIRDAGGLLLRVCSAIRMLPALFVGPPSPFPCTTVSAP